MKCVANLNKRKHDCESANIVHDTIEHTDQPSSFRSKNKRLKMESSTPIDRRSPRNISLDSSPLGLKPLLAMNPGQRTEPDPVSVDFGVQSEDSMSVGVGG